MSEQRTVIVTCRPEEGSIQRVRIELEALGFQVEEVLEFAGSILGSWDKSPELLEQIDGVDAVEFSAVSYPLDGDGDCAGNH